MWVVKHHTYDENINKFHFILYAWLADLPNAHCRTHVWGKWLIHSTKQHNDNQLQSVQGPYSFYSFDTIPFPAKTRQCRGFSSMISTMLQNSFVNSMALYSRHWAATQCRVYQAIYLEISYTLKCPFVTQSILKLHTHWNAHSSTRIYGGSIHIEMPVHQTKYMEVPYTLKCPFITQNIWRFYTHWNAYPSRKVWPFFT